MSQPKAKFASRVGLVAATVGSAVGLGNIWRFPAEAQANGGAAFLLIYIACVLLLGVPVMVAEFALGRAGGSDAVGSFKNLGAGRPWWGVGLLAIVASFAILSFYMVVTGWTVEYLWLSVSGDLYEGVGGGALGASAYAERMNALLEGGWAPLFNTYLVILVNLVVLAIGVQKGIERLSNVLMPLLFLIVLILGGVSLSLPKAGAGLEFFFKPDFSVVTVSTVIDALGQAFFSLSLGMGILITYASYFKEDTKLAGTAVTVSLLDMSVSVLMGIVIFPAVMSFGLSGESLQGVSLVFVTLPEVFASMPGTQLWSVLFFLLLFVAALTSTISISEVSVAFLADRFGFSRLKSSCLVLVPLAVISTVCCQSQYVFNTIDNVATNLLLPLVSLGVCVYVGWFAPKGMFRSQLTNNGKLHGRIEPTLMAIIRYLAPVLIITVLISGLL